MCALTVAETVLNLLGITYCCSTTILLGNFTKLQEMFENSNIMSKKSLVVSRNQLRNVIPLKSG